MILNTIGRKLFSPTHHLWIRAGSRSTTAVENQNSTLSNSKTVLINVGLTSRGLEDIGDINTITSKCNVEVNKEVKAGDHIIDIEWDGHVRSESDELYHAVWETFTKETAVLSPISGIIRDINIVSKPSRQTIVDDDTTLFSVEIDYDSYQNISHEFVNNNMYKEVIKKLPRGMFYDDL